MLALGLAGLGFKTREPRLAVMIQARMRCGAAWKDIFIRNISSRGMLVQAESPPAPGTYVEIRKASETVVGRAVWRGGRHFGVRTQDRVNIDALLGAAQVPQPAYPRERRVASRRTGSLATLGERSRALSSAFQYLVFGAIAVTVAGFGAVQVERLLGRPFAVIESHLSLHR